MATDTTVATNRERYDNNGLVVDFPALQLARTGRIVRTFGRMTFILLVVSVLAVFFVPWRQTARGTGIVTALDPQERPQPVHSPSKGVISYVKPDHREGSRVEKGQLFVIVPEATELAVEMKVSGNDMPLIHEGDRVRLQFEGWPAVQFVGWPSVAVGTFGGNVNRVFPTDDGKGNFRILVSEAKTTESDSDWPDDRYLRQGVRANGWVLLKRVPLGYEIWRQLNGFPPTVADEEPYKSKEEKKNGKVKLPKG